MSAPAKPLSLNPQTAYIHITSSQSPSTLAQAFDQRNSQYKLQYLGPVGELQGEHVFEVRQAGSGSILERGSALWKEGEIGILSAVKGVEGVKGAKVLDVKQRTKRDEF
jgi:hypothetical protein